MSEYPDDWFRDPPAKANPPGGQGHAGPTVQLPRGQAAQGQPTVGAAGAGAQGAGVQPGSPARGPAGWDQRAGGAPGTGWPQQPPRRTPAGPAGPGQWPATGLPGRRRRWTRPRIIIAVLALLLCLGLVGSVSGYFYLDSKLTKINALVTSPATAGQNWLITGSTGHLNRRQIVQLHTGFNFDTLSDTILVLHVPASGGRPTLVSIPRDSYVAIPGHGMNKINAAYAFGGAPLLVRTVQDSTGLHIDHYLGIGYSGLVSVVNAVGGVTVCLPGPVIDPKAGIHLPKGCDTLNGRQALGFVRTRQFATGDLQRVQDQRILLKAVLAKLTSFGTLINPLASIPAATGSVSAITVDRGTSLYQLVNAAFALTNPVTTTVPFGGFATETVGSVVLWDTARARQLFHDLAADRRVPRRLITGSKVAPTA